MSRAPRFLPDSFFVVLVAFLLAGTTTSAFAAVAVTVRPRRAPVTFTQTQQFKASVFNTTNTAVTWLVDGVAGGNSTVGTITTSGLYTPPHVVSKHTVTARSKADTTKLANATVWVTNYPGMMTYHADQFRSGVNGQEFALSPATVNVGSFGKLFSRAVDGQLYAQPLHVSNLFIAGGFHNVVYVATEHDSVYAFDADGKSTAPFWKRSFINPAAGITTIPKPAKGLIAPEIGITATPVIDIATQTIYVSAQTMEQGGVVHRLHALSLTTGAEKFGGPIVVSGSAGGATFVPNDQLQRPALLLLNGVVYISFGSNGDNPPWHGWLIAYSANGTGTLHQVAIHCTSPAAGKSAIWMTSGPAADSLGNIYIVTGNGVFDLNTGGQDEGDSFVKLASPTLTRLDFFTPFDQSSLNTNDLDLNASGILLPPFQTGAAHPRLVVAGGKEGIMYLVDRDNMGQFNATTDMVVQKITLGAPFPVNGNFFTPASWNGFVYFGAVNDNVRAFKFTAGILNPSWVTTTKYGYPGATPAVSAAGNSNGIVWTLNQTGYVGGNPAGGINTATPAVLHAYNALSGVELYNSKQAANNRDTPGNAIKFTVPTIANGRVYVGTANQLNVFGPLP